MIFGELPRDENGVVQGSFKLRHRSPDFSHGFGQVEFVDGESIGPVDGPETERLLAALAPDVEAFPWSTLTEGEHPGGASGDLPTPTTLAELEQLSEDQLRQVAAQLGGTDKRWKAPRLRNFIADELGIDVTEAAGAV